MVKSPRFFGASPQADRGDYAFLGGADTKAASAAEVLAARIEGHAIKEGWRVETFIGSEAALMDMFEVNRDTLREAIRVLQGRGAVKVVRGRAGGVAIAMPSVARTAAALTLYMHSLEVSHSDVAKVLDLAKQLGAKLGRPLDDLLGQTRSNLEVLRSNAGSLGDDKFDPFDASDRRGLRLALVLMREAHNRPGYRIGTELQLCERFDTSLDIIRQALRVLVDLDLVQMRRGRSGGAFTKQPQPVAMLRQLFAYLAAGYADPMALNHTVTTLNLAHLHLAHARIAEADRTIVLDWRDTARGVLDSQQEPLRYILMQEFIGQIAASPLIDTILRCVVSYQTRFDRQFVMDEAIARSLGELETRIVEALFDGDLEEAVLAQRTCHSILSDLASTSALGPKFV